MQRAKSRAANSGKQTVNVLAWPFNRGARLNPHLSQIYRVLLNEYAERSESIHIDDLYEFSPFRHYHILHVHFPEGVDSRKWHIAAFKVLLISLLLAILKLRRCTIVWTIHNDTPHGVWHKTIWRIFFRFFLSMVDIAVPQNGTSRERYRPLLRTWEKIPLPLYSIEHAECLTTDLWDKHPSLSSHRRKLTYFGLIRPYKGVIPLVDAFSRLDDEEWNLVIAGEVRLKVEDAAHLAKLANTNPNVVFIPEFLDQDSLVKLILDSDAVVLPYRRVSNSGSALFSASLGTPPILPDFESMRELRDYLLAIGQDCYLFDHPISASKLKKALQVIRDKKGRDTKQDLEAVIARSQRICARKYYELFEYAR